MNGKNKSPGRKWWMGWPAFFWILSGAVIVDLVWLMIAAKMGMGFGFFAGSDSTPPGLIIDGAAVFCGAVLLAFLVFWTRPLFAWPFIRIRGWLRWLFKWLSAFALLVALFYAEEDWRGKRNWEQYKRAAEAKGERFDLSSRTTRISFSRRSSPIAASPALTGTGLVPIPQTPMPGVAWRFGSMPAPTGNPGPRTGLRATGHLAEESI